jgi:hypothetical protein
MSELSLQEYFMKYNLDYTKIKHKHKKILSTDSSVYSLENRGNTMGVVIIQDNVGIIGSFTMYPLFQLLQVKVNISTWNNHCNHWMKKEWSEEKIINNIFNELKK